MFTNGNHTSTRTKITIVLTKNSGYEIIWKISEVLNGEENDLKNLGLPENMTLNDF